MRRVAICGPRTIAGTAEHAKPHHSFTVNSSCERRHIHATTPQVTAAPAITDGTVPSSFAARPDSNAPRSFDELMKILLTARTRPRRCSGGTDFITVSRMIPLPLWDATVATSPPTHTTHTSDNPNTHTPT